MFEIMHGDRFGGGWFHSAWNKTWRNDGPLELWGDGTERYLVPEKHPKDWMARVLPVQVTIKPDGEIVFSYKRGSASRNEKFIEIKHLVAGGTSVVQTNNDW